MTEASPKAHWMGRVPPHWNVKALKFCAELISERVDGSTAGESTYIGLEHIQGKTGRLVRTEGSQDSAESTVSCFRAGDVLFGKLRPYLAKAAAAESDGVCSSEILVYRPHTLTAAYLKHVMLLSGFIEEVTSSTYGSKMPRADAAFISRLAVPQPPVDEQLAIASYLDVETARIDGLTEAKRKLLNSLFELKAVRITEIMTGAADHVVPTGDVWLPQIPQGWTLKRLKHLGQVRSGLAKGKKHDAGTETRELPYMRVANVQDGHLDLSDVATLEVAADDVERYSLVVGDVLMNEGGDYDKLGRGAVWEGKITPCLHQNHVFAVRLDDPAWAPWVSSLTRTAYAKFYFMNNSKQSTNLASISQSNVKEWPVVLPPEDIRDRLLNQLSVELKRTDDLIEHVEFELAVLEEFRSATITDAVLGRIDVREYMKN